MSELGHIISYITACASIEDLNQTAHAHSLVSLQGTLSVAKADSEDNDQPTRGMLACVFA